MFNPSTVSEKVRQRYPDIWTVIFLVVLIVAAYSQVHDFEFINLDDQVYVEDHRYVKTGLTLDNLAWAFVFRDREFLTYWHPLTWLSHMLDSELFGADPGRHHLVNVLFHIANSLLLFTVFRRMTGARWPSAFVAALFAVHPLNVESVAWVAERKNVLSTFFWLLTMHAYAAYTRRPALSGYLLTILTYVMGLMAKPMLVTLPFVLLLMDYWPLGRFEVKSATAEPSGGKTQPAIRRESAARLIVEKIPLLGLSLASVYLSSSALRSFQTIVTTDMISMKLRVWNALVSYVKYILKMLWPQKLAVLYPFPDSVPLWQVFGATLFLCGICILTIITARKKPYLLIGWLWFLGTLVPVSGIIQAGLWPEMADRWAYVPMIGLFMMIAWGGWDLWGRRRLPKTGLAVAAGLLIAALLVVTEKQVGYWRNSRTLFEHTLGVTDRNAVAHLNLGAALERASLNSEAIGHYREALKIDPSYADAHNNLGGVLSAQGRLSEARDLFNAALKINPNHTLAHYNLAKALSLQGMTAEAVDHYTEAIRLNAKFTKAYNNLGNELAKQGRIKEAVGYYIQGLKIDPEDSTIFNNLRAVLASHEKGDLILLKIMDELRIDPQLLKK